jgi:hypothetical protein
MGQLSIHGDAIWIKECPAVFSRVVVAASKEFIHKFLEVYLDG